MALTFLAVVPAYASPVTMVLVAVSFLLAIKGLPSAGWIYPAAAAIGLALYMPWLSHLPRPGLLAACVAGAYVLWAAGEVLRRHGEGLCDLLGLKPLDYGAPPFNLAAGLGAAAFLLKFDRVPGAGRGRDRARLGAARARPPVARAAQGLSAERGRPCLPVAPGLGHRSP